MHEPQHACTRVSNIAMHYLCWCVQCWLHKAKVTEVTNSSMAGINGGTQPCSAMTAGQHNQMNIELWMTIDCADRREYVWTHGVQRKKISSESSWVHQREEDAQPKPDILLELSSILLCDILFSAVTETPGFLSPGLIDMMHTAFMLGENMDNMRSCLPLEGGIHWVVLRLVFVSCYSAGDQYTTPCHSLNAQIKMTLPLVCM